MSSHLFLPNVLTVISDCLNVLTNWFVRMSYYFLPESEPLQNIINRYSTKNNQSAPHKIKIVHNYILEYHKWIETHFKLLYSLYSLCYLCHLIEKIKLNTGCPKWFWGTSGDQTNQYRIFNFWKISEENYKLRRFISEIL